MESSFNQSNRLDAVKSSNSLNETPLNTAAKVEPQVTASTTPGSHNDDNNDEASTAATVVGPFVGDASCVLKQTNTAVQPVKNSPPEGKDCTEKNACGDVMNSEGDNSSSVETVVHATTTLQEQDDNKIHEEAVQPSSAEAPKQQQQVREVKPLENDTKNKLLSSSKKTATPQAEEQLDFRISLSDDEDDEDGDSKVLLTNYSYDLLENQTPCPLCDHIESDLETSQPHKQQYLCHLVWSHNLVVADVNTISNLRSYAIHWKNRLQQGPIEDFCTKIRTNSAPTDTAVSQEYYLLCDALPEDRKVREELQKTKLKQMLLRQEFERKDTSFERTCLFCNDYFCGNRLQLFNHMATLHGFNVGHPDNIVNIREFLDLIESKLKALQCLLCENKFKDRISLREHMRKKLHRKLNPKNKEYDRFYMINYLEFGKNWEKIHEEPVDDRDFDDYSGWDGELQLGTCFYCNETSAGASSIYEHMRAEHAFDFTRICQEMQMSFYQQVKMINYIRKEVRAMRENSATQDYTLLTAEIVRLLKHKIMDSNNWNKPQFYFPAVQDDSLLCQLDENKGLFEPEDTFVISEDLNFNLAYGGSILCDLMNSGAFEEPPHHPHHNTNFNHFTQGHQAAPSFPPYWGK